MDDPGGGPSLFRPPTEPGLKYLIGHHAVYLLRLRACIYPNIVWMSHLCQAAIISCVSYSRRHVQF